MNRLLQHLRKGVAVVSGRPFTQKDPGGKIHQNRPNVGGSHIYANDIFSVRYKAQQLWGLSYLRSALAAFID